MPKIEIRNKIIAWFFLCITTAFLINNSLYSFCWSDEGFYLSTVQRLANHERLVFDEWSPTQFYALFLLPIYKAFLLLHSDTAGIYLFFRILVIIFQFCIALFSFNVLSKQYHWLLALTGSLLPLIFIRGCIYGPSYYVFAQEMFLLGILCLFAINENHSPDWMLIPAGLAFGAAIVANPYLFPFFLIGLIVSFYVFRKYIAKLLLFWGSIISIGVWILLVILLRSSGPLLSNLLYIYRDPEYQRDFIHILKTIHKCPKLLFRPFFTFYLPITLICIGKLLGKLRLNIVHKQLLIGLNTCIFIICSLQTVKIGTGIVQFFPYSMLNALIATDAPFQIFYEKYKKELCFFCVPGICLAFAFCCASNVGFEVCAIGMTIAFLGEVVINTDALVTVCYPSKRHLSRIIALLPAICILIATYLLRINLTYRDGKLPFHIFFVPSKYPQVSHIEDGPAKGLYTDMVFAKQYNDILQTVRLMPSSTSSLFVSKLAPWVFLIRPEIHCAAPTTWRLPLSDYRLPLYYQNHSLPDAILVLDENIRDNGNNSLQDNAMTKLLEQEYLPSQTRCGTIFFHKQTDF